MIIVPSHVWPFQQRIILVVKQTLCHLESQKIRLFVSHITYLSAGAVSSSSVDKSSVDFSGNSLFCCGTKWNGSLTVMSYEAINMSLPL
jgi:hypothetical protein